MDLFAFWPSQDLNARKQVYRNKKAFEERGLSKTNSFLRCFHSIRIPFHAGQLRIFNAVFPHNKKVVDLGFEGRTHVFSFGETSV